MAFKHLLVPTDFSEPANHALRYAIEEAGLHGARITLLHVLSPDTRTDVHYVSGEQHPRAEGTLDPMAGGRVGGSALLSQPTVVRAGSWSLALATRGHGDDRARAPSPAPESRG